MLRLPSAPPPAPLTASTGLDVLLRAFASAFDGTESRVRLLLHLGSCTEAHALSAFMQSVGLADRIGTQVVLQASRTHNRLTIAHLPRAR